MNIEDLRNLGLTDEQAKSVFALHSNELNQTKAAAKAELETLSAELSAPK